MTAWLVSSTVWVRNSTCMAPVRAGAAPADGLAIAGHEQVVCDAHVAPPVLVGVVVDAAHHVWDDVYWWWKPMRVVAVSSAVNIQ